jgi:hypothetical protein
MTDIILVEDPYGTFKPLRQRDFYGSGAVQPAGFRAPVEFKTGDFTLTAADSGKTFIVTGTDKVATLPPTDDGLRFTFIVGAASATTGLQISPNSVDKIMTNGITPADDKDYINTAATDAVGDMVTVVGDGLDGWYVTNKVGTWARQA